MLRKITGLRNEIEQATDEKLILAKGKELDAALQDARKSHLPCIREDIRLMTVDVLAAMSIAALSDMVIIPITLSISTDLSKIHETRLSELFQTYMQKDLLRDSKAKSMLELLNGLLPKPIERAFEQFLNEKKLEELTLAAVREFVAALTEKLCKALAEKGKCDVAKLPPAFFNCVMAEVVRACMHEVFQVTDNQQTAGMFSMLWGGIRLTREKIIKPYTVLPMCAALIEVEASSSQLWCELMRWFDGSHLYHFNLLRQKLRQDGASFSVVEDRIIMPENKPYPPVNSADSAMNTLYGTTFYHLAKCALSASEVLRNKLIKPEQECDMASVCVVGFFSISSASAADAAVFTATAAANNETRLPIVRN